MNTRDRDRDRDRDRVRDRVIVRDRDRKAPPRSQRHGQERKIAFFRAATGAGDNSMESPTPSFGK